MYSIDNFIEGCEALKIAEYDYSICNETAIFDVTKLISTIIKIAKWLLKQLKIFIMRMRKKPIVYAEAYDYITKQYTDWAEVLTKIKDRILQKSYGDNDINSVYLKMYKDPDYKKIQYGYFIMTPDLQIILHDLVPSDKILNEKEMKYLRAELDVKESNGRVEKIAQSMSDEINELQELAKHPDYANYLEVIQMLLEKYEEIISSLTSTLEMVKYK